MKSYAVVATTMAAIASTASAADKCVLTELVSVLEPITAKVYACYDLTKFAVIPPRANPTAEQTTAVCTQCADMIATAKTITYPSCYFTIEGVDTPLDELMAKWQTSCASSSSATTAGSSSSSSSAPAVGSESNSTAEATVAASSGSSSGSAGASDATVRTPAPTTATPSSSGVVASLSAAAFAVGSIAALAL